jgi:hypothetical protein
MLFPHLARCPEPRSTSPWGNKSRKAWRLKTSTPCGDALQGLFFAVACACARVTGSGVYSPPPRTMNLIVHDVQTRRHVAALFPQTLGWECGECMDQCSGETRTYPRLTSETIMSTLCAAAMDLCLDRCRRSLKVCHVLS